MINYEIKKQPWTNFVIKWIYLTWTPTIISRICKTSSLVTSPLLEVLIKLNKNRICQKRNDNEFQNFFLKLQNTCTLFCLEFGSEGLSASDLCIGLKTANVFTNCWKEILFLNPFPEPFRGKNASMILSPTGFTPICSKKGIISFSRQLNILYNF